MNPIPEWLTVEDFCRRYHFKSSVHVKFMARAGRIPGAKKKGRNWLFDRAMADAWDENPRQRRTS